MGDSPWRTGDWYPIHGLGTTSAAPLHLLLAKGSNGTEQNILFLSGTLFLWQPPQSCAEEMALRTRPDYRSSGVNLQD